MLIVRLQAFIYQQSHAGHSDVRVQLDGGAHMQPALNLSVVPEFYVNLFI